MRTIVHMAIGLAALVAVAPACLAQDSAVLDRCKSAGTGIGAEERQTHDKLSGGLRLEAPEHGGVFVAAPIGKVWVDPELVDGQPTYVRRTKVRESMTIVEVSATPFLDEPPGSGGSIGNPAELPASW